LKLLILFNVVTLLVAVHYLLLTFDTPMFATTLFYIVMWIVSVVMLIWIRMYYGEVKWLDYDEDPTRKHFTTWLGGLAGVIVAASVVPRIFQGLGTAIYVPPLAGAPLDVWSLASGLLFTICLTANAEETFKTVAHTAIYQATRNEWFAILLPIAVWSLAHAYLAYTGALQVPLVLAAFVSGIVLFFTLKHSKSLLLTVLVHSGYNALVILLTYGLHLL